VLLARYLGPREFGTYRLALNVVWGLEVVSVLAFPNATTKFVAERSAAPAPGGARAIVLFFAGRATLAFAAGFLVLLVLREPLARFYDNEALASTLIPAALAVLPGVWFGIASAALQGLGLFSALGGIAAGLGVVTLAGTFGVLAAGGGSAAVFALGIGLNTLGLALAARAGREHFRRRPAGDLDPDRRRRMWRYGLVLGLIGLPSALLSERLEVFIIARFWSAAEVGFYSLAAGLALHARRLAPSALAEALFPAISRLEGARDRWGVANAYVQATRYLTMMAWPLAFAGAILAEPAIRVLFGPEYRPAAPVLAVLMLAAGLVSIGHPAVAVIYSQERHRFIVVSSLLVVLLNVGLDLALIPAHAGLGAAVANTLAQLVLLGLQTLGVARWLGVAPPAGTALRSLVAGVVAFGPVAGLRWWLGSGDLLGLAVLTGGAGAVYAWLLAVFGAVESDDLRRLRALGAALPGPLGAAAARLAAALDARVPPLARLR
jgi:O-antigen/teichoic acid export membrane protein